MDLPRPAPHQRFGAPPWPPPVVTQRRVKRRFGPGALIAIGMAFVAVQIATAWSFGSYVLRDNGDTMQQRAVTWARDHRLGWLVDRAEEYVYSKPPSRTPAARLSLGEHVVPATAAPVPTTPVPPTPAPMTPATTGVPLPTTLAPTTTPTTTTPPPPAPPPWEPAPIAPLVEPALEGEGQWQPIAAADANAVWATSLRPLPAYPSVTASMAMFDATHLRAGMFNGSEIPGGRGWQRGNKVPDELQPAVVAAFNGGFRLEHIKGGYETEGRVVKRLVDGEATLAISRSGAITIGQLGRDLIDDGTWLSLRQNLPLMVDDGVSQVANHAGVWWGSDYHNKIYVTRSAVCLVGDGHFAYATVGPVDAPMMADALVALGCVRAMQLDINGQWPTFVTYGTKDDGGRQGVFLDRRMGGDANRYLRGSSREFVALFDASKVPTPSALDGP
jgi:Phosphodiester glycosidase